MDINKLKSVIISLTKNRGADKTICPSEAARDFADGDNWRQYMDPVRQATIELNGKNIIQIEQDGARLDVTKAQQIKGPIRLRWMNSGNDD